MNNDFSAWKLSIIPSNISHQCPSPKFITRKHEKFNRIDHFQHEISNIFACGTYLGYKLSCLQSEERFVRLKIIDHPLQCFETPESLPKFQIIPPNVEDGFASLWAINASTQTSRLIRARWDSLFTPLPTKTGFENLNSVRLAIRNPVTLPICACQGTRSPTLQRTSNLRDSVIRF